MVARRPEGVYVRYRVGGDEEDSMTPTVPACSHPAFQAHTTHTLLLPEDTPLLSPSGLPALASGISFRLMYRPKGPPPPPRELGRARLSGRELRPPLPSPEEDGSGRSCEQDPFSPLDPFAPPLSKSWALPLDLAVHPSGEVAGGEGAPAMRIRLTYERSILQPPPSSSKRTSRAAPNASQGSESGGTVLVSRGGAEAGRWWGRVELPVRNALSVRVEKAVGLLHAAQHLARLQPRCRLIQFDGPNTFFVYHLDPPPPGASGARRFYSTETAAHSFTPSFEHRDAIPLDLSAPGVLRLLAGELHSATGGGGAGEAGGRARGEDGGGAGAVLVVEAWHRVPRDVLEPDGHVLGLERDARVREGAVRARDLFMASARVPLHSLLRQGAGEGTDVAAAGGSAAWHILRTADGDAAGAVRVHCGLEGGRE
ncbi:hypothetical protein T484DRAFT_1920379, partial [Baffinella frigidus]